MRSLPGKRLLLLCALVLLVGGTLWASNVFTITRTTNPSHVSGQADGIQPGGDRENSYAWCMSDLTVAGTHYMYVGSNRDLLDTIVLSGGMTPDQVQSVFGGDIAPGTDYRARIFRYNIANPADWEQVYVSPTIPGQQLNGLPAPLDWGYRGMITFQGDLYVAGFGGMAHYNRLMRFNADGTGPEDVLHIPSNQFADSLRPVLEYHNTLLVGTSANDIWVPSPGPKPAALSGSDLTAISATSGWTRIATDADFGNATRRFGGLWQMAVFNDFVYAVIGHPGITNLSVGFELWKGQPVAAGTAGANAAGWKWTAVVGNKAAFNAKYDSGMGIPFNSTACPFAFKDHLYVGTLQDVATPGATGGIGYLLQNRTPCQLYRLDANDNAEMVIGDPTAQFPTRIGNYGSGFFNPSPEQQLSPQFKDVNFSTNEYLWWMEEFDGKLFCTTFDMGVFIKYVTPENLAAMGIPAGDIQALQLAIAAGQVFNPNLPGFDLYESDDGVNFLPVTLNGINDQFNYGGRTLKAVPEGLFVGTANPFYGCQVYKLNAPTPVPTPTPIPSPSPQASPTTAPPPFLALAPAPGGGGGGCFIATAAFGSPMASQLTVLRSFRDHYLLTNGAGTAFVHWYYREGPKGAIWMNLHPASKFWARLLLYPLVALAWMVVTGWIWVVAAAGVGLLAHRRLRLKVR